MKHKLILVVFAGTAGAALGQQFIQVNRRNAVCGAGDGLSTCYFINQLAEPPYITLMDGNNAIQCGTTTFVARMTPKTEYVQINIPSALSIVKPIEIQDGGDCGFVGIFVGPNNFADPDVPPGFMPASWGGLTYTPTGSSPPEISLYGGISGNLSGPITNIDRLIRFDCVGAIQANISATEGAIGRGAKIFASSTTSSGNISISKIESIDITADINSNIVADIITGDIAIGGDQIGGTIRVTESMLGNIAIGGSSFYVQLSDFEARLQGDITTGIDFGTIANGNGLNSFAAWDFSGSLFVGRDVCSPIIIDGDWEDGTEVIRIGRSLEPRATGMATVGNRMLMLKDQIPGDGLQPNILDEEKLIIINAGNHTPTADDNGDGNINLGDFWLGDVAIGFVGGGNLPPSANKYAPAFNEVLIGPDVAGSGYFHPAAYLAPYYKALSYELGGGAIGVAPFNFHQFTGPLGVNDIRDCSPYHTEIVAVDQCDELTKIEEVIIDHYGPVYVNGTTGQHYKIEYRPNYLGTGPGGAGGWVDVSDQFMVDTTFTDWSDDSTPNRMVRIVPVDDMATGFNAPGRFRFRPMTSSDDQPDPGETDRNMVLCADVDGNPPVMYQSSMVGPDGDNPTGPSYHWYMFRVNYFLCENSMAFEGDQVNSADMSAWLSQPFEVNADGQTDTQDFVDMADAYNN